MKLNDPCRSVREEASKALEERFSTIIAISDGKRIASQLMEILDTHEEYPLRHFAVDLLGRIRPAAFKSILTIVKISITDKTPTVRSAALNALKNIFMS